MVRLPPLAKIRAERNLTQQELADLCGIDVSVIAKIESRRTARPFAKTVGALARGLGMTIDEILAALEDPSEVAS